MGGKRPIGRRRHRRWIRSLILLLLALSPGAASGLPKAVAQETATPPAALSPTDDYRDQATDLWRAMTVEERVGQVFLVSFYGDTAPPNSAIATLVDSYHVGGVALRAANDNIVGPADTVRQVTQLSTDLQRLALEGLVAEDAIPPGSSQSTRAAVPLLIAINQEGDGAPYTAILNGLTPLPSNMALGATWQPTYAQQSGAILGRELNALGINFLLGPSLDVLDTPAVVATNDQGTRLFGGDPFWVGLMGQAFTAGIHDGSNGRVAVIAKHFPGFGGSDRAIDDDVATVRRSLDQLEQVELAPFFAVTGGALPQAVIDGLLTTHIRFQGFQGSIRTTTAPISFDPQALGALLNLPPIANWYSSRGIIVSDALGVRAVRRFYDNRELTFPHRIVAKDAFLAGNDLLYLANFALNRNDPDAEMANMIDTIVWFQEKYREDLSFRQRLDAAAIRLLALKLKLYEGDLSSENVLDRPTMPAPATNDPILIEVAQAAISLLAPNPNVQTERLLAPPQVGDQMTIFTDVRPVRQCSRCPSQADLGIGELEARILALYGPGGSGQIENWQINSHSYAELDAFLDAGPGFISPPAQGPDPTTAPDPEATVTAGPTPAPQPSPTTPPAYQVQESLRESDWVIFAMVDSAFGSGNADAMRRFLALRPVIAANARVVVFSFGAPYYLDSTEVSRLAAFYGVYSKNRYAVDAAARALFQEIPLRGASPVNVESVGYNLFQVTQPAANQIIELYIADASAPQGVPGDSPLELSPGDNLNLRTGIILDHNGHPVPDGTLVEFLREDRQNGIVDLIARMPTANGTARVSVILDGRSGQFRITANSGSAQASQEVDISTGADGPVIIIITLTPAPTPLVTATFSPSPTATPIATRTPAVLATSQPPPPPNNDALRISWPQLQMLLSMFMGLTVAGGLGATAGRRFGRPGSGPANASLWTMAGSLLAYNYLALALPGTSSLLGLGALAGLVMTLAGGGLGLILFVARQRV